MKYTCAHCGKEFERSPAKVKNLEYCFCSIPCRVDEQRMCFLTGENKYWKRDFIREPKKMTNSGYIYEKGCILKPMADMDVFADDRDQSVVVDDTQVELLDRVVAEYLTKDERMVLELRRSGATLAQMRDLLGMAPNSTINKTVDSVVGVAKFFVENVEVLDAEKDPILRAFARGVDLDEIAIDNKVSRSTIKRRLAVLILNHPHSTVYDKVRAIRQYTRNTQKGKNMANANWRDEFRKLILERVGNVWYVWGGQSLHGAWALSQPSKTKQGTADCSGLVLEVLKEVGVLPKTFPDKTASELRQQFSSVTTKPEPGDLAFYGQPNRVSHVMFHLGTVEGLDSDQCVVGMAGGGRSGMTYEQARLLGVGLWVRTSPKYRKDFLGYRKVN